MLLPRVVLGPALDASAEVCWYLVLQAVLEAVNLPAALVAPLAVRSALAADAFFVRPPLGFLTQ